MRNQDHPNYNRAMRVLGAMSRAENPKFREMWAQIFLELMRNPTVH
jgi:hypothetical protein